MRRALIAIGVVLLVALGGALLSIPPQSVVDGPRPDLNSGSTQLLANGNTIRQTIVLHAPISEQATIRVWAQLIPSVSPFLRVRCLLDDRVVQQTLLDLPPPDGTFHAVDLPWCDAAGRDRIAFELNGRGIVLLSTSVDRFDGELSYDATPIAGSDLALQFRRRAPGIDRYLRVSAWAAGKPGVWGSPHFYVLLLLLYVALAIGVLLAVLRWAIGGRTAESPAPTRSLDLPNRSLR